MKALIKDFCALTLKFKSQVFGYIESLYAFYSYASPGLIFFIIINSIGKPYMFFTFIFIKNLGFLITLKCVQMFMVYSLYI